MINDKDDPQIADYWKNLVIYIFPILNPDGYEYTRTDKTNPRVFVNCSIDYSNLGKDVAKITFCKAVRFRWN